MGRATTGSGLAGLLLLAAYIFAMWHWNADIQREADTRKLQEKIVAWVSQQPARQGGYTWDDLRRAGVVTEEESRFLARQGYVLEPQMPEAPRHAIVFRQRRDELYEKYIYRDGSHGYERGWPSPDGRRMLWDRTGPAGSRTRLVQLTAGPRKLGEYPIDGYQRDVLWSPNGDFVVIGAPLTGGKEPFTLWQVTDHNALPLPLPAALNLSDILSRETQHQDAKFGMNHIAAKRWLTARELLVFAQGAGTYIDPATKQKMGFNVIYHVVVDVRGGRCTIGSLDKQHFAASVCK